MSFQGHVNWDKSQNSITLGMPGNAGPRAVSHTHRGLGQHGNTGVDGVTQEIADCYVDSSGGQLVCN